MENPRAFPYVTSDNFVEGEGGMTLRDYFAGQALQGFICLWSKNKQFEIGDYENMACMSYEAANAMLLERSKS